MSERRRFERLSVEVSDEGLAEMDRNRRNVFVPRDKILEVNLSYGLGSERPLVGVIFGIILLIVGLWPLRILYSVLTEGGTFYIETMAAAGFLLVGGWLIYFSLKKRLHFMIRTERDRRKILFHGKLSREDLMELLRAAENDFGYSIHRSVSLEDLLRQGILQEGSP
jgi:hypothetical protein